MECPQSCMHLLPGYNCKSSKTLGAFKLAFMTNKVATYKSSLAHAGRNWRTSYLAAVSAMWQESLGGRLLWSLCKPSMFLVHAVSLESDVCMNS